ncbi:MAG: hypothetical protein F6K16_24500 [Symploca sp. SIO2B6]|nr:hypothetical protein [Symploca sp. SIO2B6]
MQSKISPEITDEYRQKLTKKLSHNAWEIIYVILVNFFKKEFEKEIKDKYPDISPSDMHDLSIKFTDYLMSSAQESPVISMLILEINANSIGFEEKLKTSLLQIKQEFNKTLSEFLDKAGIMNNELKTSIGLLEDTLKDKFDTFKKSADVLSGAVTTIQSQVDELVKKPDLAHVELTVEKAKNEIEESFRLEIQGKNGQGGLRDEIKKVTGWRSTLPIVGNFIVVLVGLWAGYSSLSTAISDGVKGQLKEEFATKEELKRTFITQDEFNSFREETNTQLRENNTKLEEILTEVRK